MPAIDTAAFVGPPTPRSCVRNCIVVADIELEAWLVGVPAGRLARAHIHVTDETGAPLSGIEVFGRFVVDGEAATRRPVSRTKRASSSSGMPAPSVGARSPSS